jgi:hypothetical protein
MRLIGFENRDRKGVFAGTKYYKQEASNDSRKVLYVDIIVYGNDGSSNRFSFTLDYWTEMVEYINNQLEQRGLGE